MSDQVLATINVEFLLRLGYEGRRQSPSILPAYAPCVVEIVAYEGYRAPNIGWRINWPAENEMLLGIGTKKNSRVCGDSYGPMTESTPDEKIARAESEAYRFLADNGCRIKRWERVKNL